MVMIMMVVVIMAVVVMMVVVIHSFKAAHTRAEGIAVRAVCNVGARRIGTLPFDVVVVAFLNGTNFALKPQNAGTVFAQNASWRRHRPECRVGAVFSADVVMLAFFER
jgi:hypothetical protein